VSGFRGNVDIGISKKEALTLTREQPGLIGTKGMDSAVAEEEERKNGGFTT